MSQKCQNQIIRIILIRSTVHPLISKPFYLILVYPYLWQTVHQAWAGYMSHKKDKRKNQKDELMHQIYHKQYEASDNQPNHGTKGRHKIRKGYHEENQSYILHTATASNQAEEIVVVCLSIHSERKLEYISKDEIGKPQNATDCGCLQIKALLISYMPEYLRRELQMRQTPSANR